MKYLKINVLFGIFRGMSFFVELTEAGGGGGAEEDEIDKSIKEIHQSAQKLFVPHEARNPSFLPSGKRNIEGLLKMFYLISV